MKLADAWIHGLRRFGGERAHRVRFDAKLVCLIGANEAGKSTVLDALDIAHKDQEVAPADRTRREHIPDDRQIVRLRYRLDDSDRDAITSIAAAEGPSPHWYDLFRLAGGDRQFNLEPSLFRDRRGRGEMARRLEEAAEQWWPEPSDGDVESSEDGAEQHFAPDQGQVEGLREQLLADQETLPAGVLEVIDALAGELTDQDDELAEALSSLAGIERL